MFKHLSAAILGISLILPSITTTASAAEIEGDDARNIVVTGKVLGMTLFDNFFKEVFGERYAGYVYSVVHEEKLYTCYNFKKTNWFCETFE